MRRVLVCSLLVLALAGCGSTAMRTTSPSTPAAGTPADSSPAGSEPAGTGSCAALTKQDLAAFIVGTQLLAQVRDKATLEGITSGTVGSYSPDQLAAILAKMSFLTGDAADGLAAITSANDAVKGLAAGSPSQAALDAYQQKIGGVAGLLKAQLAVNLGLVRACPNLG